MEKIDTTQLSNWRIAVKCRPIKARPVNDVIDTHSLIFNKLLLRTLEGNISLRADAIFCIGEAGDVWMQDISKLEKKYTAIEKDINGWVEYQPKPENETDVIEVTSSLIPTPPDQETDGKFYIIGQWGENIIFQTHSEKNVQRGEIGDFICRNRTDHSDVWIVRRRLFLNTYAIKE